MVVPAVQALPVLPQLHAPVPMLHLFAPVVHLLSFVASQMHVRLPPTNLHTGFAGVQPMFGDSDVPWFVPTMHVRHVPSSVLQTFWSGQVPFNQNTWLVNCKRLDKCN